MPNHVTTRCFVHGSAADVAAFRERMFVEEADEAGAAFARFDFDKIIPRPPILLEVEESTVSEYGMRLVIIRAERAYHERMDIYPNWVDGWRTDLGLPDAPMHVVASAYLAKHPDWEAAGMKRLKAIAETGFAGWYSWSIANWGTKWNSYDFALAADDPLEFTFDTAWSFPTPVFDAFAREYPSLRFCCVTFNEGGSAAEGWFNPASGERPYGPCAATDDIYERVHGEPPDRDDEQEQP